MVFNFRLKQHVCNSCCLHAVSQPVKIKLTGSWFIRSAGFYLTVILLFADPLNLFIGFFIYGGDAMGIARGLSVHVFYVQLVSGLLFSSTGGTT